ncbi:MAG: SUMF1/EgtB/PvdO family nonheme iron enzyme [Akkermansiaceae bacterium]|nr:SUMF1/EgtB/PvdO family nonheme iron enzyme [Akkermansiaceae bacterium]
MKEVDRQKVTERAKEDDRQKVTERAKEVERKKELEIQRKKVLFMGKAAGEKKLFNIAGKEVAFHWCPPTGAGGFMMGSPDAEDGHNKSETRHKVVLSQGFWMMETEVTQGLWKEVMDGGNPSSFKKGDDYPVEQVSWEDCQKFIEKLNASGKLPAGLRAALPTEAQWEYACRAGRDTVFHYGNSLGSHQANFHGNYPYGGAAKGSYKQSTVEVRLYQPNDWGLYDMHGNVWEWCADWYDEEYYGTTSAGRDPAGAKDGRYRVLRGGSWSYVACNCRSAYRGWYWPGYRGNVSGFRLSLQVPAR